MLNRRATLFWTLALLGCGATGAAEAGKRVQVEPVPLATPMGVTIQSRNGQDLIARNYSQRRVTSQYYADAKGMALYTFDADKPNQSSCYEECARAWPPFIVSRGAKPFGEWSVLKRKDGRKQWSYQGKPLYTYAKDTVVGDPTGVPKPKELSLAEVLGKGKDKKTDKKADAPAPAQPASATETPKEESSGPWRLAAYSLAQILTPHGIKVDEVPDANGEALVDADSMTLYTFDGDPNQDNPACGTSCASPWTPLAAAQLANPVGDFTLIDRKDGMRQWAYKGKALYRFAEDLVFGDAKGIGADERWQVALVKRFYLPPQVRVQHSFGRGYVLTTPDGMTLYRRNSYGFELRGHSLPKGVPVMPEMGRVIGTRSCDAQCMKTWIPLEAPRGALANGFWEVLTQAGGKKQWSYKGYALYRYAGDRQPGDFLGVEIYDLVVNQDLDPTPDAVTEVAKELRSPHQIALYWSHVYP